MAKDNWQTISMSGLCGLLDTRSLPADLIPGTFRWREKFQCTTLGQLRRREGFSKLFPGLIDPYPNFDFHAQGATREPLTMGFESTSPEGDRALFVAGKTFVAVLDETTGLWTRLVSGLTDGGYHFKAAELNDKVLFTNNAAHVQYHVLGSGTAQDVPELVSARHITAARVILQWSGFTFLMNVVQDGVRVGNQIARSDYKDPLSWNIAALNSLAGDDFTDNGDDILAAVPFVNFVYLFTRRSIWKMTISVSPDSVISLERVYNEPKNQTGCLKFPNMIATDGQHVWFGSGDGIYKYGPYLAAPERDDYQHTDWLHRASGVIYTKPDAALDADDCESPIMEYVPDLKELWFSWPSANSTYNNWTLRAQTEKKTADVDPHGWTFLVNYRRTPTGTKCNETQSLIGASATDWAIKQIGGVFYHEFVETDSDLTVDVPLIGSFVQEGYNSVLRGTIPLGLTDRNKTIKRVLLDHQTASQDVPCVVSLRIGKSFHLVDSNSNDLSCSPQWTSVADRPLECPDPAAIVELTAKGQFPDRATEWIIYEDGKWLYFELTIRNANHTPAIGADSAWSRVDFEASVEPKGYS